MRVGLTGGIGSGKSVVGATFADLGASVIDADELAREAVRPGSAGFREIARRWPEVVGPDGTLDRAALAAVAFGDSRELAELNAIVHPLVRRLSREREAAARGRIVVHEVPLLFETGLFRSCDVNVLVVAPKQARVQRVAARSGLDPHEVERRIQAQIDPEEARRLADYVIENDAGLSDLRERAARVFRSLETLRPGYR